MEIANTGILGIYAATFFLGIMHAVEPGHGKTVVAAYLVGTKGRNVDALTLGLVVTFTHTFSIIILAVIALYTSKFYSEEVIHSYLGIVSSLIILGLGLWMLKTRWAVLRGTSKPHDHNHFFHSHDNGDHTHDHTDHHHHADESNKAPELRSLILLGISGGIIPCPAGIAILLAAVSTGNTGKGIGLVLVFSIGLAIALVGIGLIIINSVKIGQKFLNTKKFAPMAAFLSAVIITLVGIFTLYSSLKHFSV